MARIKATHIGGCQICGNTQKLPGGVLALHGYKKGNGFFEGTCTGSGHLPIEISCELIKASIPGVEASVKNLHKLSSELKSLPQSNVNEAWVNHYYINKHYGRAAIKSGYYFIKAVVEKKRDGDYSYTGKFNGKEVKGDCSTYLYKLNTLPLLIQHANTNYARQVIDKRISIGEDYIVWAKDLVKNWKPKSLTPVK